MSCIFPLNVLQTYLTITDAVVDLVKFTVESVSKKLQALEEKKEASLLALGTKEAMGGSWPSTQPTAGSAGRLLNVVFLQWWLVPLRIGTAQCSESYNRWT